MSDSESVRSLGSERLDRFCRAFTTHGGGCRNVCECGREFYNPDGFWDWEDGELDELDAGEATAVDFTVCTIAFEGKVYVEACDCWHTRASQIMRWLDEHRFEVADYINGETKARREAAAREPTVGAQNVKGEIQT